MIWVGIRKLKSDLSRYVNEARHGQEIMVTDRGKPVARIVGDVLPSKGIQQHLAGLAAEGLIDLPHQPLKISRGLPVAAKGKSASQIILDDRR